MDSLGKRVFADVIKDPEMGASSQMICVDPKSNDKCPYKRHTKNTDGKRDVGDMKMGAEVRVMPPQARECWQPPDTGGDSEQVTSTSPTGRVALPSTAFRSPELWQNAFSLF